MSEGCGGIRTETPERIDNRPGLPEVRYRVGTHGTVKASLLAGLSGSPHTDLRRLVHDDDDPTVALLDAFSVMADVLTFYQERQANEQYLRTALEDRSVRSLAAVYGYRPKPGVAAGTWLSLTLEDTGGLTREVDIEPGIAVQSLPGPGEEPQTFETIDGRPARVEWNEMPVRQSEPRSIVIGLKEMTFAGTSLGVGPGDVILIIGLAQADDPTAERWDVRRLETVEEDRDRDITVVTWGRGLGWRMFGREVRPATESPEAYVFRGSANLFGHNAPDVRLMTGELRDAAAFNLDDGDEEWPTLALQYIDPDADVVHLAGEHPAIAPESWLVLSRPGHSEVYRVEKVVEDSRTDFAITSRTTKVTLRGENLREKFNGHVRTTIAYTEPEPLSMTDVSWREGVGGSTLVVAGRHADLLPGRPLIVRGPRAHVMTSLDEPSLRVSAFGSWHTLAPGTALEALEHLDGWWWLRDSTGREFRTNAGASRIGWTDAPDDAEPVHELVVLKKATPVDGELFTELEFEEPLTSLFDRRTTVVLGNVVEATHGESTEEVLGHGDAQVAWQSFRLSKSPVTHVAAETPSGAESTVEIWIDGVRWDEADDFYGVDPTAPVYVTSVDEEGVTTVRFGDGVNGSRLPTGQENVVARYRHGLGRGAQVKAGQLSLLLKKPLGVRSVTNPNAATGAAEPAAAEDTRDEAPLSVLTLGRIVSLSDYADFARGYAGIAKAHAEWTWDAGRRGAAVTVAGEEGDEVPEDGTTWGRLREAMLAAAPGHTFPGTNARVPLVPLKLLSYRPATFRLAAALRIRADRVPDDVLAAAGDALTQRFSFDARRFGEPVAMSVVIALLQAIEGVAAVHLTALNRSDEASRRADALIAETPRPGEDVRLVQPAELLVLEGGLEIGADPGSEFGIWEWKG